jgi:hypothetical protein
LNINHLLANKKERRNIPVTNAQRISKREPCFTALPEAW